MELYNVLYLGCCALFPLGMIFLVPESRFLVFWACLFLVPREFDVRLGPLSFCLTDMVFLGWIVPEVATFWKEGWKKNRLSRENGFAWMALGLVLAGTAYHLLVSGVPNLRFWLKDLLIYGTFPVALLALRRSRLSWKPIHIQIVLGCFFLMACAIIAVVAVPSWREVYYRASIRILDTGETLGYFIPGGNPNAIKYEAKDPYFSRVWNFIGGIPLGFLFTFFFPSILSVFRPSFRKTISITVFLAFLFYGVLLEQSRTIFASIFLGVLVCAVLYKYSRGAIALVLAVFVGLSFWTPIGQRNWSRYSLLKNKELEGIYAKKAPNDPGNIAPKSTSVSPPSAVSAPPPKEEDHLIYDTRFPIWIKAFSEIEKHPLVGLGPGSQLEFPYGRGKAKNTFVDSVYVTLALKWGFGGLLFFLAWIVFLGRKWWKAWPLLMRRDDFQGEVLRGFAPAYVSFLFLGIFYFPLMNLSFSMFLAAFLGLSLNSLEAFERTADTPVLKETVP